MKDPISDAARLQHILQSIDNLNEFVSELSYDNFINSRIHKSAVTYELQIIGEAVTRLTEPVRAQFDEQTWKGLRNLRNIAAHQYFEIDYSVIWELIKYNSGQ